MMDGYYGETNWIYFLIEDGDLLKNIMIFRITFVIVWKENLIVNLSTIKRFLKTKIKYYGVNATDFRDKEIPKVRSNYACLAVISIDFVLKKDKNYYPQIFSEECKYIEKEKKVIRYITDYLKFSSGGSNKSDEE